MGGDDEDDDDDNEKQCRQKEGGLKVSWSAARTQDLADGLIRPRTDAPYRTLIFPASVCCESLCNVKCEAKFTEVSNFFFFFKSCIV